MCTNPTAIKIHTRIETECGHSYHLNLSNLAFNCDDALVFDDHGLSEENV